MNESKFSESVVSNDIWEISCWIPAEQGSRTACTLRPVSAARRLKSCQYSRCPPRPTPSHQQSPASRTVGFWVAGCLHLRTLAELFERDFLRVRSPAVRQSPVVGKRLLNTFLQFAGGCVDEPHAERVTRQ